MQVDIDDDLHELVRKFCEKNELEYPSLRFYYNKATKEKLLKDGVDVSK